MTNVNETQFVRRTNTLMRAVLDGNDNASDQREMVSDARAHSHIRDGELGSIQHIQ